MHSVPFINRSSLFLSAYAFTFAFNNLDSNFGCLSLSHAAFRLNLINSTISASHAVHIVHYTLLCIRAFTSEAAYAIKQYIKKRKQRRRERKRGNIREGRKFWHEASEFSFANMNEMKWWSKQEEQVFPRPKHQSEEYAQDEATKKLFLSSYLRLSMPIIRWLGITSNYSTIKFKNSHSTSELFLFHSAFNCWSFLWVAIVLQMEWSIFAATFLVDVMPFLMIVHNNYYGYYYYCQQQ